MKMIWAVIRSVKVDSVTRALKTIGVSGCTVYPVRGMVRNGVSINRLFSHHKLEVIVEKNQAIRVVKEILEHSFTALEGDGILSVIDLKSVVKISVDKRAGKSRTGCRDNVRSFLVIGE